MSTSQPKIGRTSTSKDVARRAGVSQSTVSLVLAGKATGRVGNKTREAVLRAAQELGYRPNTAARTLRLGRNQIVALVVSDVSNPFFASVLSGSEQVARREGYAVVLVNTGDDPDWQHIIVDALAAHAVDGFILCAVDPPTKENLEVLKHRAVIVDGTAPHLPSILLDIEGGSHAALNHFLQLGHSKIAHLAAALNAETFQLRHRAYLNALATAGIVFREAYEEKVGFKMDEARVAAHKLLQLPDPPTAIFCDDDLFAVGVYKAAKDLDLKIPRDLSVIGFDDIEIARILEPELTTVAIPAKALGERAIFLLLASLEARHPVQSEIIPLELVVRESAAPPRCQQ